MLRYGNVAKRMFAFAHDLFAFAHGFRGGEVIGRDMGKLRRIFIFIFYSVLILLLLYIKAGGRGEGDTLVQNFFSPYYIKSREREGRYII